MPRTASHIPAPCPYVSTALACVGPCIQLWVFISLFKSSQVSVVQRPFTMSSYLVRHQNLASPVTVHRCHGDLRLFRVGLDSPKVKYCSISKRKFSSSFASRAPPSRLRDTFVTSIQYCPTRTRRFTLVLSSPTISTRRASTVLSPLRGPAPFHEVTMPAHAL